MENPIIILINGTKKEQGIGNPRIVKRFVGKKRSKIAQCVTCIVINATVIRTRVSIIHMHKV